MFKIKKIISIFVIILTFSFFVSCASSSKSETNEAGGNTPSVTEDKYYTVTFVNEGSVLKSELYKEGTLPSYDGIPTKAQDEFQYIFSGWSPTITLVNNDIIYTATYTKIKNSYTYSFYDEDGTTLIATDEVAYGTTILPPANPTKESNLEYTYQFDGWYSNGIKVTNFQITDNTSFVAKFNPIKNKYTVTWKNQDGTTLETDSNVEYGTLPSYDGNTPTKESTSEYTYQFSGWDKEISAVTGDITYTATYNSNKNKYTIIWKNYDGTILETDSNVEYGTLPSYDGNTPTKPDTEKDYYEFYGWDKEISIVTGNTTYTAMYYIMNKTEYTVNYYFQNAENDEYTLDTKASYKAYGMPYSIVIINPDDIEGFVTPKNKTVLSAHLDENNDTIIEVFYDRKKYDLSVNSNITNAGSISEGGKYKFGQEIEITASPNENYLFNDWSINNEIVSNLNTYKFTMPANDLNITADFEQYKYKLSFESLIPGFEISNTEGYYEVGKQIGLFQTNGTMYDFDIDWVRNDNKSYSGTNYSFLMTEYDLHIQIKTDKAYFTKSDTIFFGAYPKLQLKNEKLIESLNEIYGLPTTNSDWISYKYYELSKPKDYMYYIDVDYDNNGIIDYRGVYFTKYRPYDSQGSSDADYSSQDNHGYTPNKVYWFRYNIIGWNTFSTSDGYATIYSSCVLDSQAYNSYYQIESSLVAEYEHNGGIGYANSYDLSDIRKWLHLSFYLTSFSDLQKSIIQTTAIQTTYNNTIEDYIYLCSSSEISSTMYYNKDYNNTASDYALCQGFSNGIWSRTPDTYGVRATVIDYPFNSYAYVAVNSHGIVPFCKIKL